jgi:Tfp pilus assembly protein PilF
MRIIFMESLMKTRLTLFSTVCSGGLLLGCASSPSLVVAPGASPSVMEAVTESAQASYARGRHWHRQQKLDLAQAAYTQALQTDPTHLESHNALAALFATRGDVDRAIVLLRGLADSHPDAAHVFANLGYAYFLKGDLKAASAALVQAVTLEPDSEPAQRKLALVNAAIAHQAQQAQQAQRLQEAAAAREPEGMVADILPISAGVYALHYRGMAQATATLSPGQIPLLQAVPAAMVVSATVLPASPQPVAVVVPVVTPAPMPAVLSEPEPEPAPVSVPVWEPVPLPASTRVTPAVPIALFNGNGRPGFAREVRAMMPADQWKVTRIANYPNFGMRVTRIEYKDQYYAAARQLADTMGVVAQLHPNDLQIGSSVRVILGHDLKNNPSLRERLGASNVRDKMAAN